MKKMIALIAGMIFVPGMAFAALTGDCYDCHTMHNSEQGQPVALAGGLTGTAVSADPIPGLLKFDCLGCHANDPTGPATMALATSTVPQVMSSASLADSLAGGNFKFGENGANRKVHNVVDLFDNQWEVYDVALSGPPGITRVDSTHAGKFGEVEQFDKFTCAGARGCHGTRSQVLTGATTDNVYEGIRRTGIAAVSGAHHWNTGGAKTSTGYNDAATEADQIHDGQIVAEGYRFIPGLMGWESDDWRNADAANHNEYYGVDAGIGTGCGACHMEGHGNVDGTENYGFSTRASMSSTMKTPNNSMSGFCASCHGDFHSAGSGDQVNNGVSGAFLRHPSDYVIPNSGEYQFYTTYDVSAPVARPAVAAEASSTVTPGTDMVMCLSCHVPHGSEYDYLLRFDYTTMTAGQAGDEVATSAVGGCLACHSAKGSDPDDRTRTY